MIIKLKATNPVTADEAEYEMGARHYGGAVEAFKHFLRGRGWTEEEIRASSIDRAEPPFENTQQPS